MNGCGSALAQKLYLTYLSTVQYCKLLIQRQTYHRYLKIVALAYNNFGLVSMSKLKNHLNTPLSPSFTY